MKQVFLDTNVIIDYLGNRTGFYDDAAIIMSLAINQKIELYAAAISFATASYILSKNNDNNRIKTLIADFCNICKVVLQMKNALTMRPYPTLKTLKMPCNTNVQKKQKRTTLLPETLKTSKLQASKLEHRKIFWKIL